MKRLTLTLIALLSVVLAGPGTAGAGEYPVDTCQTVSGPGVGPAPVDVSSGRFSADINCRLGSGGQIGYRLAPTNQAAGQNVSRNEWAALQWQIPSGVSMVRARMETSGTATNGSGSGFGAAVEPWMVRSFGLGFGGVDLFGARFSVANNLNWFRPGDSPGVYGWFWGNESGGLGTPVQWSSGKPFSFSGATGDFSSVFMRDWAGLQMGATGLIPKLTETMPAGPYGFFRAELRCASVRCQSAGFTRVTLQEVSFAMSDTSPPTAVRAEPFAGVPGSPGDRMKAGAWTSGGTLPIDWSGTDAGTGVSGAKLLIDGVPVAVPSVSPCPGGRPGTVRSSFKPCGPAGTGRINFNLDQAPQGRGGLTVCVEDGVSQRTCSSAMILRHDSVAPAIDAPAMELRQAGPGFELSLANPDFEQVILGERAPQESLTFSVQKRIGSGFETVVPERTVDIRAQGSGPVLSTGGINLRGDGVYRVCARLRDTAGNGAEALTCTNLTVDDALPDTSILSGPEPSTGDTAARFTYTSDRPADTTFECRRDQFRWTSCPGPMIESPFVIDLAADGSDDGEHLFEVRAILPPGTSGNSPRVDPTPAAHRWSLDTLPPDTTITSDPGPLTRGNASFGFVSTEPGTFQCSLDLAEWTGCTTPFTYADLADGIHGFRVRAIDLVGNTDPTPAAYEFLVDRTPPVIEVTERPFPVSDDPDAGFSWDVIDANPADSRCRLDEGQWSAWGGCMSPWSLEDLDPGAHTVEIQAKDAAGNVSETTVITFVVEGPPVPPPPPVPARRYCALTDFRLRPTADGIRASLTASRYTRFVRIQFFPDTPSLRRILNSGTYRELRMHEPDGPILALKRRAYKDRTSRYFFPEVNLRTTPAWYRFRGDRLIAVPRVSNEWNRCVVRYRQVLRRDLTAVSRWKRKWGIGSDYRLKRTGPTLGRTGPFQTSAKGRKRR